LLDAEATWPEIGPYVLLAATALEVLVSKALVELAGRRKAVVATVPNRRWRDWLEGKPWTPKSPSIENRFDTLLKLFTGYSLKEHTNLWDAFVTLK
jgi:hypothetical protein